MIDLISETVGGAVIACNDDFFAPVSNLIKAQAPVWKENKYTDRGKWMDGWESRRRREPGHDWCVIALGIPGRVQRVTVDTSFFTGNYPEAFSLDAVGTRTAAEATEEEWVELIPRTDLAGDTTQDFEVTDPHRITHLRLKIYPDGGVARLRVYGDPIPAIGDLCPDGAPVDLASLALGGEAIDASDVHYSPPSNLLRPTESRGMWDGWETKRRRGPGNDWVVVRLGVPGSVESFLVDTRHFKGNAPGWVSIDVSDDGSEWHEIVAKTAIAPHEVAEIPIDGAPHAGYARVNIHPDGGLARFRVMGHPDDEPASSLRTEYVNALFPPVARSFFGSACSAHSWIDRMERQRPYPDAAAILAAAEASFDTLTEDDWLEAFAGHPRIGERGDETSQKEQSRVDAADTDTLELLATANHEYEARFGFTYIVYASGKTAAEMAAIARTRLDNDRDTEVVKAGAEQRKITATRLRRMLCLHPSS